jgi:hypothetical protein
MMIEKVGIFNLEPNSVNPPVEGEFGKMLALRLHLPILNVTRHTDVG